METGKKMLVTFGGTALRSTLITSSSPSPSPVRLSPSCWIDRPGSAGCCRTRSADPTGPSCSRPLPERWRRGRIRGRWSIARPSQSDRDRGQVRGLLVEGYVAAFGKGDAHGGPFTQGIGACIQMCATPRRCSSTLTIDRGDSVMREDARFRCKPVRAARERLSALSSERSRHLDWSRFWCYQKGVRAVCIPSK